MATTAQLDSACTKVFGTTELLEGILLEVDDDKTILHAQRVNTTFRACIKTSPKLQENLFLRPLNECNVSKDKIEVNPFLWYGELPATYSDDDDRSHPRTYSQIEFTGYELYTLRVSLKRNPNYSCFNMHLVEPIDEFIKIRVTYGIWAAAVKIKQQSFRETIELATSLQDFANGRWRASREHTEQFRRALLARRPVSDQPKKVLWEEFFTEKQRKMVASEPQVFWNT